MGQQFGSRTICQTVDVSSRSSNDKLRDAALAESGPADLLVNAAGLTRRAPTLALSEADSDCLLNSNANGVLRAGSVANIASPGSFLAFHEVAGYYASGAAVLSLTRRAGDGICVNAIAPGVFPTERNDEFPEGTGRERKILTRTPMHRFGRPEEVGAAVLLPWDAANFVTGQCGAVGGAYLASGVSS